MTMSTPTKEMEKKEKAKVKSEDENLDSAESGKLGALFDDVMRLAVYAAENGQLPASVELKKLYVMRGKLDKKKLEQQGDEPALEESDIEDLSKYYQVLERRLGEVTARSLRATECDDRTPVKSSAGRYMCKLHSRTFLILMLIVIFNLTQHFYELEPPTPGEPWTPGMKIADLFYQVVLYLTPFVYGALGASAFLLRITAEKLHARKFDPRRVPEHASRFVIGTLSGGVITMFIQQGPEGVDIGIQLTGAALGFLAGYSVEFLFKTIDRIIAAILPKIGSGTADRKDVDRMEQLLKHYRKVMDDEQDEKTKKLLLQIVEDLEVR